MPPSGHLESAPNEEVYSHWGRSRMGHSDQDRAPIPRPHAVRHHKSIPVMDVGVEKHTQVVSPTRRMNSSGVRIRKFIESPMPVTSSHPERTRFASTSNDYRHEPQFLEQNAQNLPPHSSHSDHPISSTQEPRHLLKRSNARGALHKGERTYSGCKSDEEFEKAQRKIIDSRGSETPLPAPRQVSSGHGSVVDLARVHSVAGSIYNAGDDTHTRNGPQQRPARGPERYHRESPLAHGTGKFWRGRWGFAAESEWCFSNKSYRTRPRCSYAPTAGAWPRFDESSGYWPWDRRVSRWQCGRKRW